MIKYKKFKSAEEVTEFFNTPAPDVNIYHEPIAITRNRSNQFDVFYKDVYYNISYLEEYEEEE